MTPKHDPLRSLSASRRLSDLERRPGRQDPAEAYLATELATTPPRRLTAILHAAVIQTCLQAVEALDAGQTDRAAARLARARRVIPHLQAGLGPASRAGAAEEMADLYQRVLRRLAEAEHFRKREAAAEAVRLLERGMGAAEAFARWGADPAPAHAPAESWIG